MAVAGTRDDQPGGEIAARRANALGDVDSFVRSVGGGTRRSVGSSARETNSGSVYWRVPVGFSDGVERELSLLADEDFPYTGLRVRLEEAPEPLVWPHLEKDGLLCLLPSNSSVAVGNPAGVAEYVLGEACRLVEDSVQGRNVSDFLSEFLSYWSLAVGKDPLRHTSLLVPEGPGRKICVWRGQRGWVLGESAEDVRRWLERRGFRGQKRGGYKVHSGVLLWLPHPLLPAEYPSTAADVRELARKRSPESVGALDEIAAAGASEINVVLGVSTIHGVGFAALSIRAPRQSGPSRRTIAVLEKGFRPGRVPKDLVVQRYLSKSVKAAKSRVERADRDWIHGRDRDSKQAQLSRARVAVLGCGSVGAPVARLLAQAGVGNFLLVDPAQMRWPNVSRHELGASSVGQLKAKKLARKLEREYPHLGDIVSRCERVGPSNSSLLEELDSVDLVISTMGNWGAESFLNDVQQETAGFPTVLYGWVEPNAAAAHALPVSPGDTCLRCGVSETGRPHTTVTAWPSEADLLQEPACGATFTPYGPTELCWAHALLSGTAVDLLAGGSRGASYRVWVGSHTHIVAAGGAWAPAWVEVMGDPGAGGQIVEPVWQASGACPVCARKGAA